MLIKQNTLLYFIRLITRLTGVGMCATCTCSKMTGYMCGIWGADLKFTIIGMSASFWQNNNCNGTNSIASTLYMIHSIYRQTCIKMSPLGQRKSGLLIIKEIQFIWNFAWQDKKDMTFQYRWLFNGGDRMCSFDCNH